MAQREEPRDNKELERSTPEYQHQVDGYLYGQQIERDIEDFERRNPGKTKSDYFRERSRNAQFDKYQEDFKKEVSGLLDSQDAGGWSIDKEDQIPVYGLPNAEEIASSVRSFRAYSPYRGDGFLLVDPNGLNREEPTAFRENTISPDNSYRDVSGLVRFFQVNNRLLKDARLWPERSIRFFNKTSPANPELANSDIVLVSCARERDGTEVVTVFDLRDSSMSGSLHGKMMVVSSKTSSVRVASVLKQKLGASPRGRVYYYGDELQNVNIRKLVEESAYEFIRRSPYPPRDLWATQKRLDWLENRKFVDAELTVVNGLPEHSNAVASMGPFVGDPADWLDLRNRVEGAMNGRKARLVTSPEGFINELTRGENDVIILVAHSTGVYLYLNGERMSIQDLKALPSRTISSRKPRLAVLISCDSGKPTSTVSAWRSLFRRQVEPLAQILVDKGFVDKVIAPDHNIDAEESMIVLRRALDGARAASMFKDWINWAATRLGFAEFFG